MPYFRDADPAYDPESQEIDYPFSDEEDSGFYTDDVYFEPNDDFSTMCREVFNDLDRRDRAAYKIQDFWKRRCEKKSKISPNVNYEKLEELFGADFVKELTR